MYFILIGNWPYWCSTWCSDTVFDNLSGFYGKYTDGTKKIMVKIHSINAEIWFLITLNVKKFTVNKVKIWIENYGDFCLEIQLKEHFGISIEVTLFLYYFFNCHLNFPAVSTLQPCIATTARMSKSQLRKVYNGLSINILQETRL